LRSVRRVLKLPGYGPLLAAYTLNELAWSIGSVALAFLVYRRTGSAIGAAAFFLCSQFVPALSSPLFVARLDQRAARRVLPSLYALEGVLFLALAWIAGHHFALAPVLVLTTLDGVLAMTARSIARATTVAVTSPAGLLREGNALTNASFSICFMAGPALGGVAVVTGGTSAALLINAGLFAVIALTLAGAVGLPVPGATRVSSAGRVRAAIEHARERPVVRRLLTIQAAGLLFFTISVPVEVVFAQHSLHAGADGYGALLSAWGGGAVAGSAIYARWRRVPARALIATGAGLLGGGFVLMAVAPSLVPALVGAAVAGAGNGVEAVSARTALQEEVEQQWMAMMMSLNDSIFESVPGAGILLGGAIAALSDPRVAFVVAGAGSLLVTAAAWVALRPSGEAVASASPAAQTSPSPGSPVASNSPPAETHSQPGETNPPAIPRVGGATLDRRQ
jgi:predicted MFS family arabinose efflux permease